jgi:thiol-disulfide isomerase/thioredoxin
MHERVKAADRRQKQALVVFFGVIILGLAVFSGMQYFAYNNLKDKPEKPCPIIVVNKTVNATVPTAAAQFSILYFTQEGCPFCAQQTPIINNVASHVNVTTVDLTTNSSGPALIQQWRVVTTPTTVVLKDGKEVARFTTVTDATTILNATK